MSAGEDAYHAKLRLTTSIVQEDYCTDDTIRYSLLFKFTNVGDRPVILHQFKPVVSKYMISANEKAATARKYEGVTHILIGINNEFMNLDSDLTKAPFIVLTKGTSYEVEDRFSITITDDSGKLLQPGQHLLQVVVLTWYHPLASNIEWREKWRDKGYLWSDSVLSEPMPFVVRKRPPLSKCK